MINLLRAEWRKLSKHTVLVMFTLGILPVGAGILLAFQAGAFAMDASLRTNITPHNWIEDASGVWGALNSQISVIGRVLPLAFMAVAFAGEYQSGTWKTTLPGQLRVLVLIAKFVVITAMVWVSLIVLAGVNVGGNALIAAIGGQAYGVGVDGQGLSEFWKAFGRESGLGLMTIILLCWVAALAAIFARSTLVATIAGLFFSALESTLIVLLYIAGRFFNQPDLINLYKFTPSYNITNVQSWLANNVAANSPAPFAFTSAPDLNFSLLVLAVWLIGLTALTLYLFQRQDITA